MSKSLEHKRQELIQNWGKYPRLKATVYQPDDAEKIAPIIKNEQQLLARGNGRCYGDAGLAQNVVSTLSMKRILSFDKKEGIISCEAGVLFEDILKLIVPAGFFLPVTPGTKFITVGGAIAADVHGKNHHKEGCFSEHLIGFDILDEHGNLMHCNHQKNPELFNYSIGGMGWTGIITKATFSLKKIETAFIRQETIAASSLKEIMQLFEASNDWTYTMAWLDILQSGKKMGRSILFRGEHAKINELTKQQAKQPLTIKTPLKLNVPFSFPSFVLNKFTVQAFNWLYYNKNGRSKSNTIHFDPFFYPLDSIHNWNRIYGRNGFTQYQLLLPKAKSLEGLTEVLNCIQKFGAGSFLSVLKLFGAKSKFAPNSFPEEGYTLSLDFKIDKQTQILVNSLDEIVKKYGGKIYLAKDAFSSSEMSKFDFTGSKPKFSSLLKERIYKQT